MTASSLVRVPLPASVRLVEDLERLPRLDIATRAATAQVFFHGAHLTQWQPAHAAEPVLWLSAYSHFRNDKAIRGGVPICFPWFGPHRSDAGAPAHGLVRLAEWALVEASEAADGLVTLAFVLDTERDGTPLWPHRSRVSYRLSIGSTLGMDLAVENRDDAALTFEAALHTYYAVRDVERIAIAGLEGGEYLDKVEGFARKRQHAEPIRFTGETDRVYVDTTQTCRIIDPGLSRTIVVAKSESRTTVVWNPWAERARALTDFGDDEWRQMVCVETANVGNAAVRLEPGASHRMHAEIAVDRGASRLLKTPAT